MNIHVYTYIRVHKYAHSIYSDSICYSYGQLYDYPSLSVLSSAACSMLLVVFLTDTRVDMYSSLHVHMLIMAEEELQIFPAKLRETSTHAQKVGGATKLEVEVSLRKMWTSY